MIEENNQPNNEPEFQTPQFPRREDEIYEGRIKSKVHPVAAAVLGLTASFFLLQIVGGLIIIMIFGFDLSKIDTTSYRLLNVGFQILFLLLTALLLSKWIYEDVDYVLRIRKFDYKGSLIFVLGLFVLIAFVQFYSNSQAYLIQKASEVSPEIKIIKDMLDSFGKTLEESYKDIMNASSILEGLVVIVVIALTPAICEEAIFRGFIQKSFEFKLKPFWAIIVTSIFFAFFHFNFYGMIPLFLIGMYLGYAAYKTNSIFVPAILHFLNNLISVLSYYYFGSDIGTSLDATITYDDFVLSSILILFTGIMMFGIIYLVRKYYLSLELKRN